MIGDCELVGDAAACALCLGDAASLRESAASLVESDGASSRGARKPTTRLLPHTKAAIEALAPVDA